MRSPMPPGSRGGQATTSSGGCRGFRTDHHHQPVRSAPSSRQHGDATLNGQTTPAALHGRHFRATTQTLLCTKAAVLHPQETTPSANKAAPASSAPPPKPIQEGPLSNPIPSPSYVMAGPKQSARSRTTPSLRASPSLEKGEQVVSAAKTPHRGSIVVGDPRGHSGSYGKHFRWVFGVMWNLPLWMFVEKKGPVRPASPRSREVPWAGLGSPWS